MFVYVLNCHTKRKTFVDQTAIRAEFCINDAGETNTYRAFSTREKAIDYGELLTKAEIVSYYEIIEVKVDVD